MAKKKFEIAFVKCGGTCEKVSAKYDFQGEMDCSKILNSPQGSPKNCTYGCLGGGTCASVCKANAISIKNGVAVVDSKLCKGCGLCVKKCPMNLIELIPGMAAYYKVRCSSKDKGKAVMNVCQAGCIGCRKCEKACNSDAIHVIDNLAHIDQDKCLGCGFCEENCPKGCITGPFTEL